MIWWLIKNYFKLSKFMDIRFNFLAMFYNGMVWEVSYKKSHNLLSKKQQKLSDEFCSKLKMIVE